MSLAPQKFREIILQLLYSFDMNEAENPELVPMIMKELLVTKKSVQSAQEKVQKIVAKLPEIDLLITEAARSYLFERIQRVERNVLRIAVFELFVEKELPEKVIISEGIRLTRKFGTPEAASFVNAVLDTLYKQQIGEPIDVKQMREAISELSQQQQTVLELGLNFEGKEDGQIPRE